MSKQKKVLIAGESWFIHMIHVKGFDTFTTSKYEEGVAPLKNAISESGYEVTYLPNHLVPEQFPTTVEQLSQYACVIFSDIGSNTLLLPDPVFVHGEKMPNRCEVVRDYVAAGGAFMMIGGYMAFSGIDAKSRYGQTAIADILPVACLDIDDRVEAPQGVTPKIVGENELDLPTAWPHFLGYNKTKRIDEGRVLMTIGKDDPFIAIREYDKGKTAVFTSDCAPHWGSPEFVSWSEYQRIWSSLLNYLCK